MAAEPHFVSRFGDGREVERVVSSDSIQSKQHEEPEERDVCFFLGDGEEVLESVLLVDVVDGPVCVFPTSVEF